MAKALTEQGHEVTVFTPYQGEFARRFDFCPVVRHAQDEGYELILANHNDIFRPLISFSGFKVLNSHSTFLPLERLTPGADAYVAVSEEIRKIEEARGFSPTVIMNPIDFERFPLKPVSEKLGKVLYLTPGGLAQREIVSCCEELGLELIVPEKPVFGVENLIEKADLVIGIGRCLLEAMAMGRNVISADHRHWMPAFQGGGMVTEENFEDLRPTNFSGRDKPIVFRKGRLKEELLKYDPKRGERLRELIRPHCEVKNVINQYIDLWTSTKNAI